MLGFLVTLVNLGLYLVLYTGYSKAEKNLQSKMLLDVVLARKGLTFTLVEMNKAISLAGLTNIALALLIKSMRRNLLIYALALLWAHSAYSTWKYYGDTHIPRVETWPNVVKELKSDEAKERLWGIKKISLVLGSAAQVLLALTAWPLLGFGLAVGHFYSMELDYKLKLGVRPYAYLPFVLGAAAIPVYAFYG
ncbi:hypothetical protein M885DRAFT_584622 [Pelagophyceae sp. CCMP2097]|nr:hypothetical protein M885DRAFT_584622 [Pelagophyceae sp. CCMP2097]